MAEAVKMHDGRERATRTRTVTLTYPPAEAAAIELELPAECAMADVARLNTMFVGPPAITECALAQLGHRFDAPVLDASSGQPLPLHSAATSRTLIIRDIDRLCHSEQVRLLTWIEQVPSCPRIISTSGAPLLDALANTFLTDLYYRLNTVYVDLGALWAAAPVDAVGSS